MPTKTQRNGCQSRTTCRFYIEQQTGPLSRAVAALITSRLAEVEPALAEVLRRHYRVEVSRVQHSQIARRCLPELLTASDAEFDWSR